MVKCKQNKINNKLFLSLVLILLAMSMLDGISTELLIPVYGIESESNDVSRWIYYKFGYIGLFLKMYVLDSFMIVILSITMYKLHYNSPYSSYIILLMLIGWMTYVSISNLMLLK